MVPVDFAAVQVDEVQALRGRVPVRAFAQFQARRHAFNDGRRLTKESQNDYYSRL